MDYKEVINFLYNSFPMFEKTGGAAYNPGLERIEQLCAHFDDPHKKFKTIHVAGTNGKGSSSHLLASVLQEAGYKTGLYTSPHLKEFTERIRINGIEISKEDISTFITSHYDFFNSFQASFFEITTLMAFYFFAHAKVDIAVIETGMGGRLDSTNVIVPEVSLITNISYDHMQYLGDTLEKIAFEKAGIIKNGIPIIVSEKQPETTLVFEMVAKEKNTSLLFAEDKYAIENVSFVNGKMFFSIPERFASISCGLGGFYQKKNSRGVIAVLDTLKQKGWKISDENITQGFSKVIRNTGLKGRWYFIQENPTILCDTAHNEAGIDYVTNQLKSLSYENLYVVLGMVKDKEITKILSLLPKDAWYFFTAPSIHRALAAEELYKLALQTGLNGEIVDTVPNALQKAKMKATKNDLIYVGGSTFVVAEVI